MAKTGLKLKGFTKLNARIKRAMRFNRGARVRAMVKASAIVEEQAKLNMKGSRTRALRKGQPVTAAEGVLGIDRGTLRSSITFVVKTTQRKITSTIGPQRVVYAAIHEFGGTAGRGSRIPPRPYLGPAVDKTAVRVEKILGKAFVIVR